MVIRHLQYLTALARERHFARAAAMCNVTQPTLSTGIKQLEESLGVLIVERGQRFLGLTAEGERVLAWAQRVLTDFSSLQQELSEMREGLVGQLRIGAIPVALPIVPLLTTPFAHRYERTDIQVVSLNSISIQRSLDDIAMRLDEDETETPCETQHRVIVGQDLSDQTPYSRRPRVFDDLFHELVTEPDTLHVGANDDREFRIGTAG